MPTLHIVFNPTGGTNFVLKYRPEPVAYGSTLPWTTVTGITGSPIDITVPYLIPYEFCIKKICAIDHDDGGYQESWEVCSIAYPASDCITPGFNFVSRTGGDFVFSYTLQPNQPLFQIQILDPNGIQIVWQTMSASITPSPFTFNIPSLINGTYRFRLRGICGNKLVSPASNWTAYIDVVVGVSGCVAPSDIVEQICQNVTITNASQPMPDAVSGVPYKHILFLTGTAPYTFEFGTPPTHPAWMTANYVVDGAGNDTIELVGTPAGGDVGTPQGVYLKVKNCGNEYDNGGVKFSGSFNVLLGTLIQEFTINNTTSGITEIDLLVNSVNVSGHRTIAAAGNTVVNASGTLINNPSSAVVVQFPIGLGSFPASADLVYTGGTVGGVWNGTLKTFTFSGIDTSVAQALVINLIP